MKTSERGLAFIAEHEGLRLKAYKDAVGVWTIGYGHTSRAGNPNVLPGMKITKQQAIDILGRDVARFERAVEAATDHLAPLNQNEFDALVSFAFNLGEGNLRKLVNGRNRATIAKKIPAYDKAGGRRLAGLTKRRAAERAMFLEPAKAVPPMERQPDDPGVDPTDAPPKRSLVKIIVTAIIAIIMGVAGYFLGG